MSDIEKKQLVAVQGQCKSSITRLEKYFQTKKSYTIEDLLVRKNILQENYAKYQVTAINLELLEDEGESEPSEDNTEDRVLALLATIDRILNALQRKEQTPHQEKLANLPALDVPIFDGRNASLYRPFIEMFEAMVHQDSRIPSVQKLCYLKKYLRGEPLQIIDNLPIVASSYASALELIRNRYDNPVLIVSSHVNMLLDIPALLKGTAQQLRDLVSKVRQQLSALKNLNQPTESWDALLTGLLLRKLDSYTVRLYHSERNSDSAHTVEGLLRFIERRAGVLEASPVGGDNLHTKSKVVAHVVASDPIDKCTLCSQQHKLFKCTKFSALPPASRLAHVATHNLCKICLGNHTKRCRYNFKCTHCSSRTHNSLLHMPEDNQGTDQSTNVNQVKEPGATSKVNLHLHNLKTTNVLLPTAKVLVSDAHNNKHVVRVLLDCGSQTSFCTTELANKLGLPQFNSAKHIGTLGHGGHSVTKGTKVTIHSMVENFKIDVTCSIIDKITTTLPQQAINLSNFKVPKSLVLADDEFHVPGEVSLLLAADVFFRIVQDGKVEGNAEDPVFLNTRLGYVVSGSINVSSPFNTKVMTMHAVVSPDLDSCVRQFWEAEKIPEVYPESLPEHEYSEKIFHDTTSLKENHFEVMYPLKIDLVDIDPSNSFVIALQRLYNLEKRFSRDPDFHDLYKKFIQEYLDLGHAKIIDLKQCDNTQEPIFYLPHHAVLRPDRITNKLRAVFDASAKTKAGHCLNDFLCNGPVVQNSLFDIILNFRIYKYTIQCDVRHMYRMISVHPDHRRLQNILWREEGVLQCLQLQTVTYGLRSSAFVATRCLVELATKYKSVYPLASEAILKGSYVDDVQGGSDTVQGVIQLRDELVLLMQLGGFNLHKWISNHCQVLQGMESDKLGLSRRDIDQDKTIVKILGLSYDAREDTFQMSGRVLTSPEVPTKRNVLSSVSRLYDPMGFAGPITVKAKLILQQIWQYNLDWDTPLPSELVTVWKLFYENLVNMDSIIIPRCLHLSEATEVQLIGYCDASAAAYGCCIYIKAKVDNKTYVRLLCSKSRVAPLASKLTIPKLELNGALILAKLVSHVASVLNISNAFLFSDSSIVLAWLNLSTLKVPAYIGNRVKEINRLTKNMSWKYTPGLLNPADILSRGADPKEIVNSKLWLQGPDYLTDTNNYNFYLMEIERPINAEQCLGEQSACLQVTVNDKNLDPFFERFSNLFKMVRVTVYMLRFFNKCKGQPSLLGLITVQESRKALLLIIKGVQKHYFQEEFKCIEKGNPIKSNLKSLTPFINSIGNLRVGGRLSNSTILDFSKKFNLILPKHCHITKLIITQEHLMLLHGGLKLVLGSLCQKYYIVNSIREVKSVINKCLTCCRHKAIASQQLMGALPKERITPARVFENVGIDYCGPFEIKQSTLRRALVGKGYVAVFVCFASKAVSMEVVSDMTTDTFLAALKRFISRRGNPSNIYCDNASTFRGANNKLKQLLDLHKREEFQKAVSENLLQRNIQFHFIPKYSPNHGGLWESAVKGAKFHLKRIASNRLFTYEQFNTIIIEIEGILNSRPLTPLSHDPSDFSYLTPGHFITGTAITSPAQPDLTAVPTNRLRFWRSCEQIRQHFWRAWSREYLSSLNHRTKWQKTSPNLKVGMVVLLIVPNSAPLSWPLGRIAKVFYGSDSKVRVVEVQTADKKMHSRAVSKIVVLPVEF